MLLEYGCFTLPGEPTSDSLGGLKTLSSTYITTEKMPRLVAGLFFKRSILLSGTKEILSAPKIHDILAQ